MIILGINAYHGDASAALLKDGKLIAACEEERFNRIKHCAGLPSLAVSYCLKEAGVTLKDVDILAVSRDPYANFFNKVRYITTAAFKNSSLFKSRASTMSKLRTLREDLEKELNNSFSHNLKIKNVEHHLAHMASAFFVSPFKEAACLSIDGFGDFVSTKIGMGREHSLQALGQVCFPHSTGILYTATTQYLGFPHYGDEGKIMGLAPYGNAKYVDKFRNMITLSKDFHFELNLDYFHHHDGTLQMSWIDGSPHIGKIFSDKFVDVFGPAREKGAPLEQHHKDIAASLQAMLEEVYLSIAQYLRAQTQCPNLCLAGGVALNSVCNGKLVEKSIFDDLYIQAAAGDGGTSLGAVFYVWHQLLNQPRSFEMKNAYLGPHFDDGAIEKALQQKNVRFEKLADEALYEKTAGHIADGKVVGWFQGRTEFGPRALGNRSILADPRRHDMKDILNKRIKHREPFRPFAPSILAEKISDYFEQTLPSPFMLKVYPIKREMRERVPAITHVDGTGRLQTVTEEENPRYYNLIKAFYLKTDVPIVLNTSFNENEPIVNTPEEAIDCYLKTDMDTLVLGNYFVCS